METVFLVNRNGEVLDIVEIARYAEPVKLSVPCTARYRPHALATAGNGHLCIVLSPSHEIKVFAEGVQTFSFRNARWHLLDLQAKYEMWQDSHRQCGACGAPVPDGAAISRTRGKGRCSWCFAIQRRRCRSWLRRPISWTRFVTRAARCRRRAQLLHMLRGRNVHELDPAVLRGLARTDGATVVDRNGRLLAVGAILLHTEPPEPHSSLAVEGARTTAAMAAGRFGAVLKVSEDGLITFYDQQERIWDI